MGPFNTSEIKSSGEMQLRVSGCGDAFGSGGRLNTCFYVKGPGENFLIDCGASVLPGLKKYGIGVDDIDMILITHFHGDHYGGLPFLLLEASIYGRKKTLTIISPPGCKERVAALLDLLYPGTEVLEKLKLRFVEYRSGETITAGSLLIKACPAIHTKAALPHSLRIQTANKIISYSGDTEWTEALVELAEGADLFICECNFFSRGRENHLNYEELLAKREQLNCKRMLLTHLGPEMLGKPEETEFEYLYDGMMVSL